MRVSKICNFSILKVIAEAKEITYKELKAKYLPPKQPGIIQDPGAMFDSDLKTLESEGLITINSEVICFVIK